MFTPMVQRFLVSTAVIAMTTLTAGILWNSRSKATSPDLNGLKPIQSIDLHKYQGVWYEQRRIEASFERGLDRVTAQYSLQNDNTIAVVNMVCVVRYPMLFDLLLYR